MNIYYMGENITKSRFPIKVWNEQVQRNVGATQCPAEEYQSKTTGWGEPEKGGVGADAGLRSVNSTDDTRTDSFPKENK
jgi:hypothetical protein